MKDNYIYPRYFVALIFTLVQTTCTLVFSHAFAHAYIHSWYTHTHTLSLSVVVVIKHEEILTISCASFKEQLLRRHRSSSRDLSLLSESGTRNSANALSVSRAPTPTCRSPDRRQTTPYCSSFDFRRKQTRRSR